MLCKRKSATNIIIVTNNVLDWSKLERDSEAICRPIYLDMRTVCEAILMLLPHRDDEGEVELMVVVSPDVPHSLFLDETYIQRILMNLLSNALKFTNTGYILLLVEIQGGNLVATVKDTGVGIPSSFLPDLFEPFKQAQTRGTQRGTGLGLSIIKQLLHKMQGSIDVDSKHISTPGVDREDCGSTFTITIPVSLPESSRQGSLPAAYPPEVAILQDENEGAAQSTAGLCTAWKTFGYHVTVVHDVSELYDCEWKYVWADLWLLQRSPSMLAKLMEHEEWTILVPYDDQEMLQRVPKILATPHFTPIPKPLLWHFFEQRVAAAREPGNHHNTAKGVRFAPSVEVVGLEGRQSTQDQLFVKRGVVLLVEDNPVRPHNPEIQGHPSFNPKYRSTKSSAARC